jgi:hypothetical protein
MNTPKNVHDPLALFPGKTRKAVLKCLLSQPDKPIRISQFLRAVESGHGAVQRELKHLTDVGLVRRVVRGREVYIQANQASPFFSMLQQLIADRTEGNGQKRESVSDKPSPKSRISVPKDKLTTFCKKNHIQKLSFFGSILRDDFRPDSDIDLLVEFEPGYITGLFKMIGMESELSSLLGRKVDLRTPKELSRYFRDRVVREAEVYYAAAG